MNNEEHTKRDDREAEANEHGKLTVVVVAPNGATLAEHYLPKETVNELLSRSVKLFGEKGDLDPSAEYILVKGESALEGGLSLQEAGIKPGDSLKIRSKKIPGDGNAPRVM